MTSWAPLTNCTISVIFAPPEGRNEFIFFAVITLTLTEDSVTNSSFKLPVTTTSLKPFKSSSKIITRLFKFNEESFSEIF